MKISFCLAPLRYGCMAAFPCALQEPPCLHWWCRFPLAASCAFSFWIHWHFLAATRCLQYPHSKQQLNWEVLSFLTERGFLCSQRLDFIKVAKLCNIIASPKKIWKKWKLQPSKTCRTCCQQSEVPACTTSGFSPLAWGWTAFEGRRSVKCFFSQSSTPASVPSFVICVFLSEWHFSVIITKSTNSFCSFTKKRQQK